MKGILAFRESALPKALSGWKIGVLVLVFAVVSATPIGISPPLPALTLQTALSAIGFGAVLAILFVAAKAMNSRTSPSDFLGGISATVALTSSASLLLSLAALQADAYLGSQTASSVAFSLLPFYSLAAVGWAADALAGLKNERGIPLALLAIILLAVLQFGLESILTGLG